MSKATTAKKERRKYVIFSLVTHFLSLSPSLPLSPVNFVVCRCHFWLNDKNNVFMFGTSCERKRQILLSINLHMKETDRLSMVLTKIKREKNASANCYGWPVADAGQSVVIFDVLTFDSEVQRRRHRHQRQKRKKKKLNFGRRGQTVLLTFPRFDSYRICVNGYIIICTTSKCVIQINRSIKMCVCVCGPKWTAHNNECPPTRTDNKI